MVWLGTSVALLGPNHPWTFVSAMFAISLLVAFALDRLRRKPHDEGENSAAQS